MSTHFYAVCLEDRACCVLGVATAGQFHAGNGSQDEPGRRAAWKFLLDHVGCELKIWDEHQDALDDLDEYEGEAVEQGGEPDGS